MMKQHMNLDEALLVADGVEDDREHWRTTSDWACLVLGAEVRRLRAALNTQVEVAERCIVAMNENADRGEAAELDAKRYRWLRSQHWSKSALCVVADPKDAVKLGHTCPTGEYLDMAVDDEMGISQAPAGEKA